MGRPKPQAGKGPETLSFSVPHDLAVQVRAEIEPVYGGSTAWFRRVTAAWFDNRVLREENDRLRRRNVQLEGLFLKIHRLVGDVR